MKQLKYIVKKMKHCWNVTYIDKSTNKKAFALFSPDTDKETIYSFLRKEAK